MPKFQAPKRIVFALALLAHAAVLSPALSEEPRPILNPNTAPWRLVLGQQLRAVKACDLNEVLSANEIRLGEDLVLDGRASCIDGREFTFTRRREHQAFEFELCEPTVC